jgi:hypothetical protein
MDPGLRRGHESTSRQSFLHTFLAGAMTPAGRLRLLTRLLAFLAFAFFALLGGERASAEQSAPHKTAERNPGASLDKAPVQFSIAGTVYRVPRNYLIAMSVWAGGPQEFVSMRVNGPRLTPLTKATRRCLSDDPFALSAKIMIEPPSPVTGCMPFEFDIADPDRREASGVTAEQEFEKVRPLVDSQECQAGPFGFEKYEFSLNGAQMETYRKVEGGSMVLYVCAVSDDQARREGVCRPVGDRLTTGVELGYAFSLSMLGVIEEIDADLRRLVEEFVVKRGQQP